MPATKYLCTFEDCGETFFARPDRRGKVRCPGCRREMSIDDLYELLPTAVEIPAVQPRAHAPAPPAPTPFSPPPAPPPAAAALAPAPPAPVSVPAASLLDAIDASRRLAVEQDQLLQELRRHIAASEESSRNASGLERDLARANSELVEANERVSKTQADVARLERDLAASQDLAARRQADLTAQADARAALQGELARERERTASAHVRITELEAWVQAEAKESLRAKNVSDTGRVEIEKLQRRLDDATRERNAVEADRKAAGAQQDERIRTFESRLRTAQESEASQRKRLDSVKVELAAASRRAETEAQAALQTKAALERARADYVSLQAQVDQLRREKAEMAARAAATAAGAPAREATRPLPPADPPSPGHPSDAVRFVCPCGKRLSAPKQAVGRQGQCPRCGESHVIPATA